MQERLIANLPKMASDDLEHNSDSSDDIDVVPLDFRTAMLPNGKLVIQAKPLYFKTKEEELAEASYLRKKD